MKKSTRFFIIAALTSLPLIVAQEYLKAMAEPLVRYLVLFVLAKVLCDAVYYALQPRRLTWQYPEDYLANEC